MFLNLSPCQVCVEIVDLSFVFDDELQWRPIEECLDRSSSMILILWESDFWSFPSIVQCLFLLLTHNFSICRTFIISDVFSPSLSVLFNWSYRISTRPSMTEMQKNLFTNVSSLDGSCLTIVRLLNVMICMLRVYLSSWLFLLEKLKTTTKKEWPFRIRCLMFDLC